MDEVNKYLKVRLEKCAGAKTILKSSILEKILSSKMDEQGVYSIAANYQELDEIRNLSKMDIVVKGDNKIKDYLLNYAIEEKNDDGYIVKIKFSDYL